MANEERQMSMKDIFEKISNTMNSEYDLTGLGLHRTLKGTKREKILKNFLKDILPQQFNIGDGEIFDSKGNISRQIDIIIHNSHMPIFRYSRYLLFYPIECIFGVCEVKTKLDKATLKEAIENIQSVKKMLLKKPGIFQGKFNDRAYGAIFAFDSSDAKTIKDNITELYSELSIPDEEKPDLICVLGKFIAIGNPKNQDINTSSNDDPLFLDTKQDSLMYFTPIMINGFNKPISQDFNFFEYIGKLDIPIV